MLRHLLPNLHWQEDEGRPPPQVGWLAFTIARMPARIASGRSGQASTTAARSKSVSQVYVSNGWAQGSPEGSNSLRDLPSRPDRDGPSSPLPECPPWSTRTGRARRGDRRQVRGLNGAGEHIAQQAGWLGRSGLFLWSWRRRGWDSNPRTGGTCQRFSRPSRSTTLAPLRKLRQKTDDKWQIAKDRWQIAKGSAGSGRAAGARVVHWPTSSMMSSAT